MRSSHVSRDVFFFPWSHKTCDDSRAAQLPTSCDALSRDDTASTPADNSCRLPPDSSKSEAALARWISSGKLLQHSTVPNWLPPTQQWGVRTPLCHPARHTHSGCAFALFSWLTVFQLPRYQTIRAPGLTWQFSSESNSACRVLLTARQLGSHIYQAVAFSTPNTPLPPSKLLAVTVFYQHSQHIPCQK